MNKNQYLNIFLLIYCIILTQKVSAQSNLVPNGSFENLSSCTVYFDMLDKAQGWKSYKFTPDILNRCASSDFLSVPKNTYGYEPAASGNGYAGILTYHYKYDNELIGIKLSRPLTKGETYEVSFQVSLAEYHSRYATNNIGALFTNSPTTAKNSAKPQINTTKVITEHNGWTTIKANYTAEDDFTYIVLGNFFTREETEKKELSSGEFETSYYFIDNISVVKTTKVMQDNPMAKTTITHQKPTTASKKAPQLKRYMKLSGNVYDALTRKPLVARIDFVMKSDMKYNDFTDSDLGTGSYHFDRVIQTQKFMLQIKARNYYMITQEVNNPDLSNLKKDFYLQPLVAGNKIMLENLWFDEGQDKITKSVSNELDKLIEILNDNPTMRIELIASTALEEDLDLAKKRLESISKYLMDKGKVSPMRINTSSRTTYQGKDHTQAEHKSEGDHSINIQFKILN